MARPKGSKNKKEESEREEFTPLADHKLVPNLVNLDEPVAVPVHTPEPEAQSEIAQSDIWKYHPDRQPRIFRAGEIIPAGWTGPAGIAGKIWTCDAFGKWSRKER